MKFLKILGISMDTLSAEKELEVEAYQITDYHQAAEKYEGVKIQTVSTEVSVMKKTFPVGTAIVYLQQSKGNLAMEVLEPEVKNSFLSFGVIQTQKGDTLSVYRYLKSNIIQH